jgi:hypothetical protein
MTARIRRHIPISRAPRITRQSGAVLWLAAVVAQACLPAMVNAQSRVDGRIALSSQLVDRGLAITPATPILQGAVSWASASGWSLGAAGAVETRSPGTPVMVLARASRTWAPSSEWQAQASLLYYDYRAAAMPDRLDANLYFTYRDLLSFGVSAIRVDNPRAPRRVTGAADATLSWPVARHLSLAAGAGIGQATITTYVRRPPPYLYGEGRTYRYDHVRSYAYGSLGLAWSDGPWRLQLDRNMNSLGERRVYGARAPGWVATLSRAF